MINRESFSGKEPRDNQTRIEFVDLKKDKEGHTIYDLLKEAGIKENDPEYKKILNSLTIKDGFFFINNVSAKEYFYWRKVDQKEVKEKSHLQIPRKEKNPEDPSSNLDQRFLDKQKRREDVLYGRL